MGGLISDITGSASSGRTRQDQQNNRYVHPRMQQLMDVFGRQLLGQAVNPPNTAISVPQQQAISQMQGLMSAPGAGGNSLAARLAPSAGGASGGAPPGTSYQPTSQTGLPQAGLQTREQLGLPDRSSYQTFVPSAAEIANIGLAPVRAGTKQQNKLAAREQKLTQRRDTRAAAGKDTTKVEKRLGRVQQRSAAARGPSYL